ncbi:hypothetical protein K458DRAFT_404815 [Lentithecium fluviatile CBS 122367]|uniref:Acyltransferase 3 domain-containing protein n=1 Tax=Lentithecium fluviatile CBS 122367 TaxID=1168545 RepID=A0A6G1IY86_9PLEO|nr:hypothetical protein K458DRAFT_404815 [Lentithecium fluviatile CBS 122367]
MMKSRLQSTLSTLFLSNKSANAESSYVASQHYLIGLRGILTIQSFLFVFFQTFLPAAVADSKNEDKSAYQTVLRNTLSVLFWNESLIYSFAILISGRTICVPFLKRSSREVCSSAIFRRGIRLFLPTFVIFSLSAAAFSATSTQYISDFLEATDNISTTTPIRFRNLLVYFNSFFDIFWLVKGFGSQAANQAFPSGTLWIISVLFQQSYTVYMTMVIVPYTRTSWRVKALLTFIVTAFWVQSWAWYSVTGLLLADAVSNMNFQYKSQCGVRIERLHIPMWPFYSFLVVVGVLLQYLFVAWRPEHRNNELQGHTGLYTGGSLNEQVNEDEPQARVDNFLIILGAMLLVETYNGLQSVLQSRFLVEIGKRSFSIRLYMHMHTCGSNHELATFVCFVVCVPLVALASEVSYRTVDLPSIAIAKRMWAWIRE